MILVVDDACVCVDSGEAADVFCAGGLSSADVLTVRGPSLKRDSSSRKCSFSGDLPAGSITSQTSAESGNS